MSPEGAAVTATKQVGADPWNSTLWGAVTLDDARTANPAPAKGAPAASSRAAKARAVEDLEREPPARGEDTEDSEGHERFLGSPAPGKGPLGLYGLLANPRRFSRLPLGADEIGMPPVQNRERALHLIELRFWCSCSCS